MSNLLIVTSILILGSLAQSAQNLITCSPTSTSKDYQINVESTPKPLPPGPGFGGENPYKEYVVAKYSRKTGEKLASKTFDQTEVQFTTISSAKKRQLETFRTKDGSVDILVKGNGSNIILKFPKGTPAAAMNVTSHGDWTCVSFEY